MIALDLYKAHYRVLLIIYLKVFIVISTLIVNLVLISVKDDQLIFRCFECKRIIKKTSIKELIKRFANIYEFCNEDINKIILLLEKGVYPYEYMDSWERFDETSLPDKEAFYCCLMWEILQLLITGMQKEYSKTLIIDIYVIIMICMFKMIPYCLQMYLKTLETNVLKYMN